MTNEKVITGLKYLKSIHQNSQQTCEALNIAIEAIKKQIPKKPTQYKHHIIDLNTPFCIVHRCPVCGKLLTTYYLATKFFNNDRVKFCGDCGQALDWEDKKNDS